MDKLPPVFAEAGVELVKAMVLVGPPLFVRVPRLSVATVVAQVKVPLDTRLLALVEVPIRFTVPPPAKSLPPLLAMMVLAMLRVPLML